MLKAVLIVMDADVADDVARLLAATLTMNGYNPTRPEVIDWPLDGARLAQFPSAPQAVTAALASLDLP